MKFLAFALTFLTTATTTMAKGGGNFPPAGNEFVAPGEDDIRSPCPAINTLANHGFINRDGRSVLVQDLAQNLEDIYRVAGETLINAPIASAIALGLTETDENGQNFLTIDRLFDGIGHGEDTEAQEHDSSFFREDFEPDSEAGALLPSPRLVSAFFDATNRAIVSQEEAMEYQRGRVQESCETNPVRTYTGAHMGGMAIQGALLFALGQAQGPNFNHITKSNLRSIVESETLPHNYNPFQNHFIFDFNGDTESDMVRDQFRANVEMAICDFCDATLYDHCN